MSTKISKGSIIASFIYEKSTNLKGYEEMDLLTINEVKKMMGIWVMNYLTQIKRTSLSHIGNT